MFILWVRQVLCLQWVLQEGCVYSRCSKAATDSVTHCHRMEMRGVALPALHKPAPTFRVSYSDGAEVSGRLRPILASFASKLYETTVVTSSIGVVSAMTHTHSWQSEDWDVVHGVLGLGLSRIRNASLITHLLQQSSSGVHFVISENESNPQGSRTLSFQSGEFSDDLCPPVIVPLDPSADVHWRVLSCGIRLVQTIVTNNMTLVIQDSELTERMPVLLDTGASHVFGSSSIASRVPWLSRPVTRGCHDAVVVTRMFVGFDDFWKPVEIELVNDAPRLVLKNSNITASETSSFHWVRGTKSMPWKTLVILLFPGSRYSGCPCSCAPMCTLLHLLRNLLVTQAFSRHVCASHEPELPTPHAWPPKRRIVALSMTLNTGDVGFVGKSVNASASTRMARATAAT